MVNNQTEDSDQFLEKIIVEMQQKLTKLYQIVASAIASQKQTEQECNKTQWEAYSWLKRGKSLLAKGDNNSAREALIRKQFYMNVVNNLEQSIEQQKSYTYILKCGIIVLENKIFEAEIIKDILQLKDYLDQAKEQREKIISNLSTVFN